MCIKKTFYSNDRTENEGTEEKKNKISVLKERAQNLAASKAKQQTNHPQAEVVVFRLEKEHYAIDPMYINEVYPLIDVTVLPCVPSWIYGVINVRRKIYSVVDLKVLFGLPHHQDSSDQKVILLEDGKNAFGVLADEIIGVKQIEIDCLQSQLPTQTHHAKEFFSGITQDRIMVLNGEKLLNSESLVVQEVVS